MKTLIDEYLAEEEARMLSPNTIESKRYILTEFCQYLMSKGFTKWEDIKPIDVKLYFKEKIHVWKKRGVIRLKITQIKHFLKWLYNNKKIAAVLTDGLVCPRVPETPLQCPTPDQLRDLSKFIWSRRIKPMHRAIFLIIRDTGMRNTELCNITLEDINLKDRSIFVRTSKAMITKYVCFTEETKKAILYHIDRVRPTKYLFYTLFPVKNKEKHITRQTVYDAIKDIMLKWDKNWKGPRGPHNIRHAFATDFIDKTNGNITGLQWLMGWTDLTMGNRYVHANPAMIRKIYAEYEKRRKEDNQRDIEQVKNT